MKSVDLLAEYVETEMFKVWEEERAPLQAKWEKNREAYLSIVDNHWAPDDAEDWESKVFIGKTHQKVITLYAIVIDLVLREGKIPFSLKLDPIDAEKVQNMPLEVREQVLAAIDANIEKMTANIESQFSWGKAPVTLKKDLLSVALYGEGWAKQRYEEIETDRGWKPAPVEGISDMSRVNQDAIGWESYSESQHVNVFGYVPVWDIFCDLSTDDLQEKRGIIHRRIMSSYQVRQLGKMPLYFDDVIKELLSEKGNAGSASSEQTSSLAPALRELGSLKDKLVVKEYHGLIPRSMAEDYEAELHNREADYLFTVDYDNLDDGDEVEVVLVYCESTIIGYARVEDASERPFTRAICEETLDELAPRSVADNVEMLQELINDLFRTYIDNKKLSANVMLAVAPENIDSDFSKPSPGLIINLSEDCEDARRAIQSVTIPDVGESLTSALGITDNLIDEDSMIPKISQGVNTKKDTTAFEVSTQVESSGKYVGSIVKNIDSGLIQPWAQAVYDDAMGDPNTQGKGNFKVKASGFTSYLQRTSMIANINRLLAILGAFPALQEDINFRKVAKHVVGLTDLDSDEFMYSAEESKARQEAKAQSPEYQLDMAARKATVDKLNSEVAENTARAAEYEAQAKAKQVETAATKAEAIANVEASITPEGVASGIAQ